jgi:hypothetical protein
VAKGGGESALFCLDFAPVTSAHTMTQCSIEVVGVRVAVEGGIPKHHPKATPAPTPSCANMAL